MTLGLMVTNIQKVSAAIIEDSIITEEPMDFSNQSDDIFDGYDSMEATLTGRVGYNYAIPLPNGEDLKLGFDPRNTVGEKIGFSGIGSGWGIKIPFLDMEKMIMHRSYGYSFDCVNETSADNMSANSDATYFVRVDSNKMLKYNGPYGEYEIYDTKGCITNITDSLNNTTTYEYSNDLISKINYSDGSAVLFERTENEVDIIYEIEAECLLLATFKLAEVDNRLVLSEIEIPDNFSHGIYSSVSFEYITNSKDMVLLKKYDNGQHETVIEYIDDSD